MGIQIKFAPPEWFTDVDSRLFLNHEISVQSHPSPEDFTRKESDLTPQDYFYVPILRILVELGGQADKNKVQDRLEKRTRLTDADQKRNDADATRKWRKRAAWARNDLKEKGFIDPNSKRGIWQITDKGRRWLKEQLEAEYSWLSQAACKVASDLERVNDQLQ